MKKIKENETTLKKIFIQTKQDEEDWKVWEEELMRLGFNLSKEIRGNYRDSK